MEGIDIEIFEYHGEGYKPMIDYVGWRVAVLKYCAELLPTEIYKMQKHDETDEVFVLLSGNCILFSAGKGSRPEKTTAVSMENLKLYNVKKGVWHTHTLSIDAQVLIIENQDTSLINSPEANLDKQQQETIVDLTKQLWELL